MERSKSNRFQALNPCSEEALQSLQCQEQRTATGCAKEITNYKKCQDFWKRVTDLRRLYRLKPYLPELEDRARIKARLTANKNINAVLGELEAEFKHQPNH